jgi:preprotein translocase subunit SecG
MIDNTKLRTIFFITLGLEELYFLTRLLINIPIKITKDKNRSHLKNPISVKKVSMTGINESKTTDIWKLDFLGDGSTSILLMQLIAVTYKNVLTRITLILARSFWLLIKIVIAGLQPKTTLKTLAEAIVKYPRMLFFSQQSYATIVIRRIRDKSTLEMLTKVARIIAKIVAIIANANALRRDIFPEGSGLSGRSFRSNSRSR